MPVKHCETAILFRRYVCSSCIFSCALLLYTHSHTSKIHHHKQQHLPLPHYYHERTLSETNVFDLSPMHSVRSRALNCCCSATMLAAFARTLNSIVYEQYHYIEVGVRVRSAFDVYVCIRILSNFEKFLYIWWRQRRLLTRTRVCRKL